MQTMKWAAGCGCIEENACGDGCYWVESDLCSSCADAVDEEFQAERKYLDDEYDAHMEGIRYLANHTSPCAVYKYEKTDKCTGAENSSCFELRGPQ